MTLDSLTLVPAHGLDFKTARNVKLAFHANMEFVVANPLSKYDGCALTRASVMALLPTVKTVKLRYAKLCKSTMVKIASAA